MAWTKTLAELRTEVRENGDYQNSSVFTDAFLTRCINKAIARVHDWMIQEDPSYFETEDTLTTSAGVSTVALPSDFYKLLRLDQQISGNHYVRLRRFDISEGTRVERSVAWSTFAGDTYRYRIQGSNLLLRPQPTGADTLRILYLPHAVELSGDSDTYDGRNGYEELVVEYALLYCDKREERPLGDRLAEIQRLKAEIRSSAHSRDESEPQLLSDHGYGVDW